MHKRIHHWLQADRYFKLFACLATLATFYLSLKPPSADQVPWHFYMIRGDLILHFCFYLGLTLSYFAAFYTFKKPLLKSGISAWLIGTLLELLQAIPFFQREFDPFDLLANSLGVFLAAFIIKKLFNYSLKY